MNHSTLMQIIIINDIPPESEQQYLIKLHKYHSLNKPQFAPFVNKSHYNFSNKYDIVSYDVIQPWVHLMNKIQNPKKKRKRVNRSRTYFQSFAKLLTDPLLSTVNHYRGKESKMNAIFGNEKKIKLNPWLRPCPSDIYINKHSKQNLVAYEMYSDYRTINFTSLKTKFNYFLNSLKTQMKSPVVIESYAKGRNIRCEYTGKVFGIGMYKTGTTSLNYALSALGFADKQRTTVYKWYSKYFPCNYGHWYLILRHFYDLMNALNSKEEIFQSIFERSRESFNFGDFPWLFFWPMFDVWFPDSRYILTIRNKNSNFVNSVMRFCMQLGDCMYFVNHRSNVTLDNYQWNENDDKYGHVLANYIAMIYDMHNQRIIQHFSSKNKSHQLLVLNIDEYEGIDGHVNGDKRKWLKIMQFLGCVNETILNARFPHVNPTTNSRIPLLVQNELDWKTFFKGKIPVMKTVHKPHRKMWFEFYEGNYEDLL